MGGFLDSNNVGRFEMMMFRKNIWRKKGDGCLKKLFGKISRFIMDY